MPFREKIVKEKDEEGRLKIVTIIDPETGEIKPLTKPESFLKHFLADTEEEADVLYKKFKPTLELLASKYAMYSGLEENDYVEEGLIGLARASRDFQKERSSDFKTYAITKIKDAMREYSSTQANNVSIPQYIRNATQLIHSLQNLLEITGLLDRDCVDYKFIWDQSSKYDYNKGLEVLSDYLKEVNNIRESLMNLAHRSGTTIEQLLEKAELYPINNSDVDIQLLYNNNLLTTSNNLSEEDIYNKLAFKETLEFIKNILTPEEFDIIYAHYIDEKTVRTLGPIYGITAASMTTRIHKILKKVKGKLNSKNIKYE